MYDYLEDILLEEYSDFNGKDVTLVISVLFSANLTDCKLDIITADFFTMLLSDSLRGQESKT